MLCRNALWDFFRDAITSCCWLSRDCARSWGRFPFNQSVGFEFSATSRSEWNGILQNFQKQGNRARYTQIFEIFFSEVFFPFNFAPGKSRIFGWMPPNSEIQQFPEFLETFRGNFCTICRRFQILESFGSMESSLGLNSTRHCPSLWRDLKWPKSYLNPFQYSLILPIRAFFIFAVSFKAFINFFSRKQVFCSI